MTKKTITKEYIRQLIREELEEGTYAGNAVKDVARQGAGSDDAMFAISVRGPKGSSKWVDVKRTTLHAISKLIDKLEK